MSDGWTIFWAIEIVLVLWADRAIRRVLTAKRSWFRERRDADLERARTDFGFFAALILGEDPNSHKIRFFSKVLADRAER